MTDQVANFIMGTVSTGYDDVAITIVLDSGHGFPDPSGDNYNVVWWNSTNFSNPSDDPNVEIVRVTAKSSDTLTITRAQESTAATTKNTFGVIYKMILGPTAKTITDLVADTTTVGAGLTTHMSDTSTHGVAEIANVATVSAEIDNDITTHAALGDAHHTESHTVVSHSDTTATGAELETLTDGSDADALHAHAINDAKVTNATHTGDVTGEAALTIGADKVNDTHIDWGTGANQVSAVDVPIADSGAIITATEVEGALQEHRTAIDLNTAKDTNISTVLSVGTVGADTVAITSDGGADDVTLPAATVAAAGMLTTAKWAEIVANNAKETNVTHTGEVTGSGVLTIAADAVTYDKMQDVTSGDKILGRVTGTGDVQEIDCTAAARAFLNDTDNTAQRTTLDVDQAGTDNSTDVTLNASATTGGLSLIGQEISNRAATNSQTGYMTAAFVTNIETNNVKNTNVSTALSVGTVNTTTVSITSDGGADDVTLPSATNAAAGVATATQITKLEGIATGADVTANNAPQTHAMATHTDEGVLATLSTVDTTQIDADAVTYAKMQNVVNDERVLGRVSGANGVVEELTAAQVLTMINVEAAADVTDATNVDSAGAVMESDILNQSFTNLLVNGDFESWSAGASSASDNWVFIGNTVAREDTEIKIGTHSCKLINIDTNTYVYQILSDYIRYRGQVMSLNVWAKCSTGNCARILITDGVANNYSDYHTGGGDWELLTTSSTIDASNDRLRLYCRCEVAGTGYFDGAIFTEGLVCPAFSPKPLSANDLTIHMQTPQVLDGAGAVDVISDITHIDTDGVDAYTLVDGAEGQEKFVVMTGDDGDGTLTPTNPGNFATLTFNDVGDSAHLLFTNSAWHFMGGTATLS